MFFNVFAFFKSKNMPFYVFLELLHAFSRTLLEIDDMVGILILCLKFMFTYMRTF